MIRRARLAKGWSTPKLGAKAGYSKRTVESAEAGRPVDYSTVVNLAKALGVDVGALLPAEEPNRPNLFRVQLVLECDIREVEKSPHLMSFVELLRRMLPADGAIRLEAVSPGSVILTLEMSAGDVLTLVALFPDFHEHARAVIAESPEGRAMFKGEEHPGAESVARLLELVESVRELRIPTREYNHPPAPEPEPPDDSPVGGAGPTPNQGESQPPTAPSPDASSRYADPNLPPVSLEDLEDARERVEAMPPGPERDARLKEIQEQWKEFWRWLDENKP